MCECELYHYRNNNPLILEECHSRSVMADEINKFSVASGSDPDSGSKTRTSDRSLSIPSDDLGLARAGVSDIRFYFILKFAHMCSSMHQHTRAVA